MSRDVTWRTAVGSRAVRVEDRASREMRMKNFAAIAVLVLVAVISVALVSCLIRQGHIKLNEGIEIITLVVLVLVTSWYAYSTHGIQRATADQAEASRKQAKISKQATEIALNATKNAVLPMIVVGSAGRSGTQTAPGVLHVKTATVSYSNIGSGPALNLRVWLSYAQEELGEHAGSTVKSMDALSAGKEGRFEWREEEESPPLPGQSHGYDVVAEYTDIYGREFRSRLNLLSANQRDFSFGHVPEGQDSAE